MDNELANGASSSGKHSSMMQRAKDLKQRSDKPIQRFHKILIANGKKQLQEIGRY